MTNSKITIETKRIARILNDRLNKWQNDSRQVLLNRSNFLVNSYFDGLCENDLTQTIMVSFVYHELKAINKANYNKLFPEIKWDKNGNRYYA